MANFTHYRQHDAMDCGPTCLRMVAKYYGRSYSAQSLRDWAEIGKEGVSLLGISQAAEAIGFRTVGVKVSLQKLIADAPLPCIIHWDQNHFVVLHGIKKKGFFPRLFNRNWFLETDENEILDDNEQVRGGRQAPDYDTEGLAWRQPPIYSTSNGYCPEKETLASVENIGNNAKKKCSKVPPLGARGLHLSIADPAKGLVSYTAAEFCSHWLNGNAEGVALLLEPTPKFYEQEGETSQSLGLGSLLAYLLRYKALVFQLMLGMLVGSGLGLVFPFLTQSVVDIGVNTRNLTFVYMVLAGQLMLMFGRLGTEFIRSWILLHISTRINLSILSSFLIKLTRLPLSFFDVKLFGDLMQRIGDHHRIEAFLTNQTLNIVFSLFNLLVYGLVLAVFNTQIFMIFMVASVAYCLWVIAFLKARRKLDFRHFDVAAKNQSILIQLIQGMQEIKLANAETQKRWEWEAVQTKLFRLNIKGLALSQYQQMGAFCINEGKNILITFFAAKAVLDGQMSLGAMLAVQQLVGQLNSPIEQMISFVQTLQDAKISLERLNEIHTIADEESGQTQSPPIGTPDHPNGEF
jgi:ATP-binding cassette subfamily B protein